MEYRITTKNGLTFLITLNPNEQGTENKYLKSYLFGFCDVENIDIRDDGDKVWSSVSLYQWEQEEDEL